MSQDLLDHDAVPLGHIHKIVNWRFNDTEDRMDAETHQFGLVDVDKACYDKETQKYYILEDVNIGTGEPVWYEIPEAVTSMGEANTISSVSDGGASLVSGKFGVDLRIKGLKAGAHLSFNPTATDIEINVDDFPEAGAPLSHVGSVGETQHGIVSDTEAGFMSPALLADLQAAVPNATHYGDVAGATELTIQPNVVTFDKMLVSPVPERIVGRGGDGSGDLQWLNFGPEFSFEDQTIRSNIRNFIDLYDGIGDYDTKALYYIRVNSTEDGIEAVEFPEFSADFLALTDTPDTYVGSESLYVKVNAAGTGLEFVAGGGGGGTTNLSMAADSLTSVTINNDNGTGVSIPVVSMTRAGVMSKAQFEYMLNLVPNQTHTGDVTGSVGLTIANDAVTFAKMQNIRSMSVIGRETSGLGDAEIIDLGSTFSISAAQLDVVSFTSVLPGIVPASGGGTTNFLRADGTWAVPAGGGGGATNLAVASITGTTLQVTSDTGSDATIPAATVTEAGLLTAADKVKLNAIKDHRFDYYASTDFIAQGTFQTIWSGAAAASGTVGNAASGDYIGHPGCYEVRSSTTTNSGYSYVSATHIALTGGEEFNFVFQAKVPAAISTIVFGFADVSGAATSPSNCAYFRIVGATLDACNAAASTRTYSTTNFTVVDSTWYHARVKVNAAAASVTYTLYSMAGAVLWTETISLTVPTGPLWSGFRASNVGTVVVAIMLIDFMDVRIPVTSRGAT